MCLECRATWPYNTTVLRASLPWQSLRKTAIAVPTHSPSLSLRQITFSSRSQRGKWLVVFFQNSFRFFFPLLVIWVVIVKVYWLHKKMLVKLFHLVGSKPDCRIFFSLICKSLGLAFPQLKITKKALYERLQSHCLF